MVEAWARVARTSTDLAKAATLLDAFNTEYDDPSPGVPALTARLLDLVATGDTVVLLAGTEVDSPPQGVAVLHLRPAIWTTAPEAYLAELYVEPASRGRGLGRALLDLTLASARAAGADYATVITSADDVSAQHAYRAAGFRDTEGEGGARLVAFERDL